MASRPPFVIIGTDAGNTADGIFNQRCRDGHNASTRLLSEHLLDHELGEWM